jgi:protein-tyrosine phosphatase
LYLGPAHVAEDAVWLVSHGITHVLNIGAPDNRLLSSSSPAQRMRELQHVQYKRVQVLDLPSEPLDAYFDECHVFMHDALRHKRGRVLVHCYAGISRSATVVIAFLLRTRRDLHLFDAVKRVMSRRACILPNEGFVQQLKQFATRGRFAPL